MSTNDPAKIQLFLERSKAQGYLASEAMPRTPAERMRWLPPFVFVGDGFRLVTEPNVKAVNALTAFAKESGLWPDLPERILELRIARADLREGVDRYEWTTMKPSESNQSFGEWAQSRGYRRSPSSTRLVAVSTTPPPADTPASVTTST